MNACLQARKGLVTVVDQALSSILTGPSVLLETDGLDLDEAGGGRWLEVSDLVHGGLGGIVELLGVGPAAENDEVTLVSTASDGSVDVLLGCGDAGREEFHFWGEENTVVQDLAVVDGDEVVAKSSHFTVEGETFDINVSGTKHGETWSLVAASGLQSDEAVLDNVDSADTVSASDGIGLKEQFNRVREGLSVALELDGKTFLEEEGEVLWGVWCLCRVNRQLPHVRWRSGIWILQNSSLVGAMCQVLVH